MLKAPLNRLATKTNKKKPARYDAAAKFNKLRGINEGAEFDSPRLHSPSPKIGFGELVRGGRFLAKANARHSPTAKAVRTRISFALCSPLIYNPLPARMDMVKRLLWLAFYSLPLIAYSANFTEPRAAVAPPQKTANFTQPVKVIIYKNGADSASLSADLASSIKPLVMRTTAQEVKSYVRRQAVEYGVDPFLALWIVKHESSFNPRAKGDGDASRGLWQISRIYHPEVSDKAAFSVTSSTDWSLQRIREGKVNEWSAYRNCRTLYEDCPF
jgi:transglycosylase-like protein with SLT domain